MERVYGRIRDAVFAMEDLPYGGEPVDQLQHALQCAALAYRAGGGSEIMVAALLHDIGRSPVVLHEAGVLTGDHGEVARWWLQPLVGERVAWLAAQHVPAKRYLCAIDPAYELSDVSQRTLLDQGGPMNAEEVTWFESQSGWENAVRLRRWDDMAKVPGISVPPFEAYEKELKAVISATLLSRHDPV